MFKPLLKTLPTLSGNIKIVSILSNYEEISEHVFSAYVRIAKLNAISSQLHDENLNIALLGSSYEWDVCNFYKKYSEYFYKTLFSFNKEDLPKYDENGLNKNRNTDFEFGCKRVSYEKNGAQFAFFAPIYIESEKDLPDYFEISVDIENSTIKANRKIRVNIANNLEGAPNYLGKYLYDYALKIDDNVCFCDKDKFEGIYYGIDVKRGGFATKHDFRFQSILEKQNSILNFDSIISKGFERNKLIMKQIIPLSFYFSLNDILSDVEKTMFIGAELRISGKWIKDNKEIQLHDFETNYAHFSPMVTKMNMNTGAMIQETPYAIDSTNVLSQMNIMNIGYPSLRESLFYKYRFSNKMSNEFCRWKLKYSDDSNPYITNISPAFSFAQESKTKYGCFPNLYENCLGIVTKKPYYLNLFLPLNGGENKYPNLHATHYKETMNKYCSNWFETFEEINKAFSQCVDVKDNKAYFNGILYDLSILNSLRKQTEEKIKIDKFGVFVKPKFHFVSDSEIKDKTIFSHFAIFKQLSNYIENHKPNCHINDNVLAVENPKFFSHFDTLVKQDYLAHHEVFVTNENDDGDFISLIDYDVDWYDSNDFIRVEDIDPGMQYELYSKIVENAKKGYEILPIGKLSNMLNSKNVLSKDYSNYYDLLMSNGNSSVKMPIVEDIEISGRDLDSKNIVHSKSFYRAGTFIDREAAKDAIKLAYSYIVPKMFPGASTAKLREISKTFAQNVINSKIENLCSYTFNPVLNSSASITYASNAFVSNYTISPRFYGDKIKYETLNNANCDDNESYNKNAVFARLLNASNRTYTYMLDNDFIYVDLYNLNNIISHYNNTWLRDDEKLSYYIRIPFSVYNNDLTEPIVDSKVSYEEQLPHGNDFNIYDYPELIESIKNKYFFPYWVYDPEDENYKIQVDAFLGKTKYTITFTIEEHEFSSKEEAEEELIKNSDFYAKSAISKVINFSFRIVNNNDFSYNNWIYSMCEFLIASSGINDVALKGKNPHITAVDALNSKEMVVKFLNKLHLKYYLQELYEENPSEYNFSSLNAYGSLSKIYIKKRVIDGYLNVKDVLINLSNVIDTSIKTTPQHAINDVLSLIDYDETTNLFYFSKLLYKNGKLCKLNTLDYDPIVSDLLWGDLDEILEINVDEFGNETITANNKKFQFELVFVKTMVKVDDNIWRLINLEEKHAAPYKDLYLYELEKYAEYNSNLRIHPMHAHEQPESTGLKYKECPIGCLKPMFNLVQIETKDESKIFAEYTLCNITRSTVIDGIVERHYYRHNCDNALCMLDLSTFDRDLPINIKGTKYVYKKDWKFIEDLEDDDPRKSYVFLHDTYDLFKMNGANFANYYDSVASYVPIKTDLISVDQIFEVKASYNSEAFSSLYPDIYESTKNITTLGETLVYSYEDNNACEHNAYVCKNVIPTLPVEFIMSTYQKITFEDEVELWGYTYSYDYYDDLNLYKDFSLNTKKVEDKDKNVTTYAFYLIDSHINNTTNCFNAISYEGDDLKFISYINGVKLAEDTDYVSSIYKQIVPFVKNNPLKHLITNAYTLVMPTLFNIDIDYHPVAVAGANGKLSYYDVLFKKRGWGNFVAERYLDNITPLIVPKNSLTTYNLKYKDMDKSFRVTYFTNEVIYPLQTALNYYPGVRVYDVRKNNSYEVKADIEYKHFNANKLINLEEQFSYLYPEYLTDKEVRIAQSSARVERVFKNHLLDYSMSILDDKLMDWAFTKYKTTFGCEPVKLDADMEEKLYKLEIIFTLY